MESLNTLAFYAACTPRTATGLSVLRTACINGDYETVRNILIFHPSEVDILIALTILERNTPSDYTNYKGIISKQLSNLGFSYLLDKLEASSAIHVAARVGTASHVRRLVQNGANVNDGTCAAPPLHFAAEFNTPDVVMALVSQGADTSAKDYKGLSAAQVAAWKGKTENLLYFMQIGSGDPFDYVSASADVYFAFVNLRQGYFNYLHLAIWGEQQETVATLIARGYDVNEPCRCWAWLPCFLPKGDLNHTAVKREHKCQFHAFTKSSPLMLAALTGNLDIFLILIHNGADIRYRDQYPNRKSLLSFAVQGGSSGIVQYVLANTHPNNWSIQDNSRGSTLLHQARGEAVAKILIDCGLDVNVRNSSKFTPIQNAAEKGDVSLVKLLVDHGAETSATDAEGRSLLAVADKFVQGHHTSMNSFKTTKYLIEKGLDVNASDHFGRTPLHHAARSRETGKIKLLLNAGSVINAFDYKGQTALHYACDRDPDCESADADNPDAAILLLRSGIRHLCKCNSGYTALQIATCRQLPLTSNALLNCDNKFGIIPVE